MIQTALADIIDNSITAKQKIFGFFMIGMKRTL